MRIRALQSFCARASLCAVCASQLFPRCDQGYVTVLRRISREIIETSHVKRSHTQRRILKRLTLKRRTLKRRTLKHPSSPVETSKIEISQIRINSLLKRHTNNRFSSPKWSVTFEILNFWWIRKPNLQQMMFYFAILTPTWWWWHKQ